MQSAVGPFRYIIKGEEIFSNYRYLFLIDLFYFSHEATSLDWKISVFGKSQCSATAG
jgi:hypothetical protein